MVAGFRVNQTHGTHGTHGTGPGLIIQIRRRGDGILARELIASTSIWQKQTLSIAIPALLIALLHGSIITVLASSPLYGLAFMHLVLAFFHPAVLGSATEPE